MAGRKSVPPPLQLRFRAALDGAVWQQTQQERIRHGEAIVVARVTAAHTECSGAGGEHILFAVARTQCGTGFQTVYMGGHAFQGAEYVVGAWAVLGVSRSSERARDS